MRPLFFLPMSSPLLIAPYKHSRYLCCLMPLWVYQRYMIKTHHRLIYFLNLKSSLLHVGIATYYNQYDI